LATKTQREEQRLKTRKRLLEDFEFYAKNAIKIRTKDAKVLPLILNRAQRRFIEMVLTQWKETGRVRVIILKARQLGLSTVWGAFMYWWVSQHRATKGVVATHKADATSALFDMTKRFHSECPELLRPSTGRSNSKELKFDKLDSGYVIATAGADTVGRGDTFQIVHLSEVGLWPKLKAKEIMNGLLQAVPPVDDTFVAIESTARGMSGPFYETWKGAVDGTNGFIPCFIPWFLDDGYKAVVPGTFTRSPDEDEYCRQVLEEYGDALTDEQLQFRREKVSLDGLPLFNQEYPTFPEDAFLTSGTPVFNLEKLAGRKASTPDILHRMEYDPLEDAFFPDPRGRLFLYKEMDPRGSYVIGADVAKGTAEGDYSCAQVLDSKKHQVAVWHGLVDPDFYATILNRLGLMFNEARLAVEFNNHGILPNTRLYKDLAYPNLYTREVYDRKTDETREELGFYTDVKTRPLIIDELRQAIRTDELAVNDKATIEELITFVADPKSGKIEADTGCHDDRVMALAIANHIHDGVWTPIEVSDDMYIQELL
jgi:hypothetical protein